ncbi:unnamed protein product [Lampetra planeri]
MPNRATIGVNNAEADRMHSETEHQGRALSAPRMPSGTCGSWHHLSRRVVKSHQELGRRQDTADERAVLRAQTDAIRY